MKIPSLNTERISSIFNLGSKLYQVSNAYSVKVFPNQEQVMRASIISGKKKIGKSAVMRNRADRRIRAALQSTLPDHNYLKGYDLLFFVNTPTITQPWPELLNEMNKTFKFFKKKIDSPTK